VSKAERQAHRLPFSRRHQGRMLKGIYIDGFIMLTKNNTMIMEKRNITMQIKEMANFIMYVLVELVFSDSYMYFDLNLNAIIIKLHDHSVIFSQNNESSSNPEICIFYM
jgi:hypothetical protein